MGNGLPCDSGNHQVNCNNDNTMYSKRAQNVQHRKKGN